MQTIVCFLSHRRKRRQSPGDVTEFPTTLTPLHNPKPTTVVHGELPMEMGTLHGVELHAQAVRQTRHLANSSRHQSSTLRRDRKLLSFEHNFNVCVRTLTLWIHHPTYTSNVGGDNT